MNPQQFAQKIKAKYPQYKNIDDVELSRKIIEKYPAYASQVKFDEPIKKPGFFQSIAQGITKPFLQGVSSIAGVANAGTSVGASLLGNENYAKTTANEADRIQREGVDYGALGKVKPIGAGFDIRKSVGENVKPLLSAAGTGAEIASTIAGAKLPIAGTVLGKVGQFGTLGAVSGAGNAAIEEKSPEEIAKAAGMGALVGGVTGGAFGVAGKGLKGLGNLLGKTGDKIQTSVIKPSQADIKDGFSIETIKKYNLGGSLKSSFSKTDATLDNLTKELNAKLSQSNAALDLNKVYENTAKRLLGNKLESFGSNAQMENAIEKLRSEIVTVAGKNGFVSIPEAQLVKRASGHFGAWTYGVPTPEATASQKVYNTFYNELKTSIEKASPEGVKDINQQISKLIPVMNALIKRIPVAERNNALSLTDIISLTGAALDPRALSISLLNLASKSGSVGSALSKTPKAIKPVVDAVRGIERGARVVIPGSR